MRDVVYCDTETTSLVDPHMPEGRRTWEVAIIREPAGGGRLMCAWLQITDVDLTHADPTSLAIGRFGDRFHADAYGPVGPSVSLPGRAAPVELWGCDEAMAARTIAELTADAVLYGSRPEFDAANFADILRRHHLAGNALPWYHHGVDIPNQALGWLRAMAPGHWRDASYPTSDLSKALGVPEPADRHSAIADAAWCLAWNRVLRGDAPEPSLAARPNGPGPRILPA